MTIPYVSGTVSVTAGSAVVTGVGTGWATALLTGGMFGLDSANGNPVPIASIDSDTQLTLAKPWRGTTAATQAYWIMRDTAYGQQTVANATALAQIINELRSPALASIAGQTPAADLLAYYTGASSAALTALTASARSLLNLAGSAANGKIPVFSGPNAAAVRSLAGSVSQSGGVPTGDIIERGSNTNGEYFRLADGTQLCWGSFTGTGVAITQGWAGGFRNGTGGGTFPASFSTINVNIVALNSDVSKDAIPVFIGATSGGSAYSVRFWRATSGTVDVAAQWVAVGRWY